MIVSVVVVCLGLVNFEFDLGGIVSVIWFRLVVFRWFRFVDFVVFLVDWCMLFSMWMIFC